MLRPLLTLNQRVQGSSPTGLTNHIWDLEDVQTPYMVAYGQRFGRDFTESAAHFGAYLLSAHPHLPRRWAASTPLACRRRVTPSPHRIRTSFASTPPALCMHGSSSKSDLSIGTVRAHTNLGAD